MAGRSEQRELSMMKPLLYVTTGTIRAKPKNRHSVGRFAQNLDCARNVLKVTSSGGGLIGSCGLENGAIVALMWSITNEEPR